MINDLAKAEELKALIQEIDIDIEYLEDKLGGRKSLRKVYEDELKQIVALNMITNRVNI
jgi:DUF2075 family protein